MAQRLLDNSKPGQKATNQSRVDDAQRWVNTYQKQMDDAEKKGDTAHAAIVAAKAVESTEKSLSLECINWLIVYAAR